MSKQVNRQHLATVLGIIQKRAINGEPMNFSTLCLEHKLGKTTIAKLKYALLEYEYRIPKSDAPVKKMHIKRDKRTWAFNFLNEDGSRTPAYVLATDENILYAMSRCPKELANPSYYKDKADNILPKEENRPIPVIRAEPDVAAHMVAASIEEHIKALYELGVSEITLTFKRPSQ